MLREHILEVNSALNILEAEATGHPRFEEVRNVVYYLKKDLRMLANVLGYHDLALP